MDLDITKPLAKDLRIRDGNTEINFDRHFQLLYLLRVMPKESVRKNTNRVRQ